MNNLSDVYTAWHQAQDALIKADSVFGQVPGVGDESNDFSRAVREFRNTIEGVLRAAADNLRAQSSSENAP